MRDDPAGWEIEKQDVRGIPENTGAGDDERSDNYDDELTSFSTWRLVRFLRDLRVHQNQ